MTGDPNKIANILAATAEVVEMAEVWRDCHGPSSIRHLVWNEDKQLAAAVDNLRAMRERLEEETCASSTESQEGQSTSQTLPSTEPHSPSPAEPS